jgi:hypothetical protein
MVCTDSPLEGSGFEPLVPGREELCSYAPIVESSAGKEAPERMPQSTG